MIEQDYNRISEHIDSHQIEYMKDREKRVITVEHHRPDSDYVFTERVVIVKRMVGEDVLLSYFNGIVNGSGCSWSMSKFIDGKFYEVGDDYNFNGETIRRLKFITYEKGKNTHHKCFLKNFTYVGLDDENDLYEFAIDCSEEEYNYNQRENKLGRILDDDEKETT